MKIFKVAVFEGKDGLIDTSKFMLKVRRRTIHPGVVAGLLAEAFGIAVISGAGALKSMFDYTKGKSYHMWCVNASQLDTISQHLVKYSDGDLQGRIKELRATFDKEWVDEDEMPMPVSNNATDSDDDSDEDA